jgi:hypothetical protein
VTTRQPSWVTRLAADATSAYFTSRDDGTVRAVRRDGDTMTTARGKAEHARSRGQRRVNVQTAMHLAGHSDARTHMRYVMKTAAMKKIPAAAVPQLNAGNLAFWPGHPAGNTVRRHDSAPAGRFVPSDVDAIEDEPGIV